MKIQRSRFARLSMQLQIGGNNDYDRIQNFGVDQILQNNDAQNNKENVLNNEKDPSNKDQDQTSSPIIKSPMKYRRGSSLMQMKNVDFMRIKQAENEGYLSKSRFKTIKNFEERKNKLNEALKCKDQKIDMTDTYIQNLAIEIAVKAIKTYIESQFLLKIFTENTIFQKYESIIQKNKHFINDLKYEFFPKNSVIYETGDFGQSYYFLLSGKLLQLLPTNEEIVSSPTKISNIKGSNQKPQLSLFSMLGNQLQNNVPKTPQLLRNQSRDIKNQSLNQSISHQNSMIMENSFLSYVPLHKFNKYIMPGTGFGDTELLSRQRRGYTIFCDEDSHLLSVSKDTFDKIMGIEKQELINQKLLFFQQFEFLEGIPNNKLMQMIDQSITMKMMPKNILYTEGQECDSIYFILKGEIHLNKILDNTPQNLPNISIDQNEIKQPILDQETDLYKAINRRRKKQERVPILILSENSYFGEFEILKKIPQRVTQAVCNSQDCEVIEVKSQKLFALVKNFGKFQNLIKNENIREEFMNERLALINNQKSEQNLNRLAQSYNFTSQSNISLPRTQLFNRDRQLTEQLSSQSSSNIKQNLNMLNPFQYKQSLRIKSQTQSFDFDNTSMPSQRLQPFTYTPSIHTLPKSHTRLDEQTTNSPNRPVVQSEKNIPQINKQYFEFSQPSINNINSAQSSSKFIQLPYDFSIQESKEKLIQDIQSSASKYSETAQQQSSQNRGFSSSNINNKKYIRLSNSVTNSPQSIQKQYSQQQIQNQQFMRQTQDISSSTKNEIIKKEMQKNLFQTFVENAEKQVLQKQAIMHKLSQNNLSLKTNSDHMKPNLFEDEFSKGFNNMYLRKFGKKYEKK